MSTRLEIQITGAPDAQKVFADLIGALNTRDILDESGAILFNRIRTRFLQETDASGQKWVKSGAALRRARLGQGGGTLYETGRLFHSLQLHAMGQNDSAIGTNVPYAIVHNADERWEFLAFGAEDVSIATQLVIARIEKAMK
jgi:phage gpG-like protein